MVCSRGHRSTVADPKVLSKEVTVGLRWRSTVQSSPCNRTAADTCHTAPSTPVLRRSYPLRHRRRADRAAPTNGHRTPDMAAGARHLLDGWSRHHLPWLHFTTKFIRIDDPCCEARAGRLASSLGGHLEIVSPTDWHVRRRADRPHAAIIHDQPHVNERMGRRVRWQAKTERDRT
jgi:hypothetical protein